MNIQKNCLQAHVFSIPMGYTPIKKGYKVNDMKCWLTLFLLICSFTASFGQSCLPGGITFNQQSEVDAFANNHPGCVEIEGDVSISLGNPSNPINNFTGIQAITKINGSLRIDGFSSLVKADLTGLENLTTIGGGLEIFMLFDNGLESLNGLEGLTSIGEDLWLSELFIDDLSGLDNLASIGGSIFMDMCALNNFQGFSSLDTIYGSLRVSHSSFNDFSGLHSLKAILGMVDVHLNSFENFQGLESLNYIGGFFALDDGFQSFEGLENVTTIGGDIDLTHSFMQNFEGLNQLCQVGGIRMWGCNELIDFSGLDNLKTITNGLELSSSSQVTSFKGLEQVTSIGGGINIFDNNSLISISELENADLSNLTWLSLFGNASLSLCSSPSICNYVSSGGNFNIDNNASGCATEDEVIGFCNENLSKVRYFAYYDLNQNQTLDPDEPFYSDASILVDPLTTLIFDNNSNGGTLYLEPGDYTLTLSSNDSWNLTTMDNSFPISITEANSCDSIYFGLFPIVETSQLITTVQSPPTRCNEFIDFEITTKNIGTTIESGILWLDIDPEILEVELIDQPDTIKAPYSYGWFFNDLYPSQSHSRSIRLQIPGPPDFPLGNLLNFFAYVDFADQSWVQNATGFRYQPEVRCSYDPNDKLVNPNREGNYTLFEEWLVYTIRFQNTGNDVAYDVVIRDTLDTHLDASTFRVLGSSHEGDLSTSLVDDQYLTFDFSNIFLPDSTADLEGSQGYVSYLIRGKEGLAENTSIENTASIYFDFNPPIVTNTTQNIMVSEIPTTATHHPLLQHISIFPNPTTDLIHIRYDLGGEVNFQLLNTIGRQVMTGQFNDQNNFSIKRLPPGVYWLHLKTKEGSITQKIIR